MNKGTITIELPILDDVDQMEVVNTFNEKQLWYVCAIAKAFEKSQQELQEIKKEHSIMKQFIYENGLWEKFLNDDRFIEHLRSE